MKNCKSCKYFSLEDVPVGSCRINPPVVFGINDIWITKFPQVSTTQWCGKWAKAPAGANK